MRCWLRMWPAASSSRPCWGPMCFGGDLCAAVGLAHNSYQFAELK